MAKSVLTLYVAGGSARAEAALRAFEEVCARAAGLGRGGGVGGGGGGYGDGEDAGGEVTCEVVDVVEEPERAAADGVLATPALVRWGGDGGAMRIVGDVTDADRLWQALGLG